MLNLASAFKRSLYSAKDLDREHKGLIQETDVSSFQPPEAEGQNFQRREGTVSKATASTNRQQGAFGKGSRKGLNCIILHMVLPVGNKGMTKSRSGVSNHNSFCGGSDLRGSLASIQHTPKHLTNSPYSCCSATLFLSSTHGGHGHGGGQDPHHILSCKEEQRAPSSCPHFLFSSPQRLPMSASPCLLSIFSPHSWPKAWNPLFHCLPES